MRGKVKLDYATTCMHSARHTFVNHKSKASVTKALGSGVKNLTGTRTIVLPSKSEIRAYSSERPSSTTSLPATNRDCLPFSCSPLPSPILGSKRCFVAASSFSSEGAAAQQLYPQLDFTFSPRLRLSDRVILSAVTITLVLIYAFYRHRVLATFATFGLAEWGIFVLLLGTCILLGRSLLLEGQYKARLLQPSEAKDEDSIFREVLGIQVHYKRRSGCGEARTSTAPQAWGMALWHGFGANTYSWECEALQRLAEALCHGSVITAHDCPGFGLTERALSAAKYTFKANAVIGRKVLDLELQRDPVASQRAVEDPETGATSVESAAKDMPRVYMGHSMGGRSAALAAVEGKGAECPAAVILVAPAIIAGRPRAQASTPSDAAPPRGRLMLLLRAGITFVQMMFSLALMALWKAISPLLLVVLRGTVRANGFWWKGLAGAWYDKTGLTQNIVDGYRRPSVVQGWDDGLLRFVYANFIGSGTSISDFLGKMQAVTTGRQQEAPLPDLMQQLVELAESGVPMLIIHGQQDLLVPVSNSKNLAALLPGCELAVMEQCGHLPMEEKPAEFVDLVHDFLSRQQLHDVQ